MSSEKNDENSEYMKMIKILEGVGLDKSKSPVYLASLQVGTGSAQEIAKKAGVPRTTAHEVLQHLVALGLVSFVTKGRVRTYTAEHPETLKKLLQEKERKLDTIMPELFSLVHAGGMRPRVRFYDGEAGVRAVFEDTLTTKDKKLYGILSMADLFQIPGKEFMDRYVERRVAAGIRLHVIRSEEKEVTETWPTSTKEHREMHYAPKEMIFPMTMYLYDNKVGLIGTEKENFGMIIESLDFFRTQKNLFDVLWQVTRVGKGKD